MGAASPCHGRWAFPLHVTSRISLSCFPEFRVLVWKFFAKIETPSQPKTLPLSITFLHPQFAIPKMSSEILDAYWAVPPMARTLTTAIVVTSVSAHLLGVLPYTWIYFHEERLLRLPPEIWRLATNFFLSGPQLGILMDPYFGMGAPAVFWRRVLSDFANSLPVPEAA